MTRLLLRCPFCRRSQTPDNPVIAHAPNCARPSNAHRLFPAPDGATVALDPGERAAVLGETPPHAAAVDLGLPWEKDDGGRQSAGFRAKTAPGDCVCRAVAIATGLPYRTVYDALNELAKTHERPRAGRKRSSARTGVHARTGRRYLESLGWTFTPTMGIGTGCRVHLKAGELPAGRLVVSLSRHWCAVVDGVIRDLYDPSRFGTRCVYGYFTKGGV